jgi:dTDP-4-amino-4,6-dideoxygalactose transaminase
MEPYRSLFPEVGTLLPNTERLTQRVLALPTGPSLGESQIGEVCSLVQLVLAHGPAVRARMEA